MAEKTDSHDFAEALGRAFNNRFDAELSTEWSIIAMTYVSTIADGSDMTWEQRNFIEGFEAGWLAKP